MHYESFGRPKEAAPTLVLSAGLGGLWGFWRPQIEAFSKVCHVIAYDHRGTGTNAGPLPDPYSIGLMADDVVEILDRAGVRQCVLMGHALGGLVGLDLALRAPERLSSLILVNAWAKAAAHTRRCFAARLAALAGGGPAAYVAAQPIFLYPGEWCEAQAERVAHEVAHGTAHFQGEETLRRRIGALLAFDVVDRLAEIRAPTLVVGTKDDVLVPWSCSKALAAGIPGARPWYADWGGHASSVTDPEPFNAAVGAFLSMV